MAKKNKGIKKGSAAAATNAATAASDLFKGHYKKAIDLYDHRKDEEWTVQVIAYSVQETLDIVQMVLHETFKFGPERQRKFHDAYEKKTDEILEIRRYDERGDKGRNYAEEKYEEMVREAVGKENYVPRDKRQNLKMVDPYGVTHFFREVKDPFVEEQK